LLWLGYALTTYPYKLLQFFSRSGGTQCTRLATLRISLLLLIERAIRQ